MRVFVSIVSVGRANNPKNGLAQEGAFEMKVITDFCMIPLGGVSVSK